MPEVVGFELVRREVFTWTGSDGESFSLDVEGMRDWLEEQDRPLTVVPFPTGFPEVLCAVNDVRPEHARRIPEWRMMEPAILLLDEQDDRLEIVVADGSHRLWRTLTGGVDADGVIRVAVHVIPLDFARRTFDLGSRMAAAGAVHITTIPGGGGAPYDPVAHAKRAKDALDRDRR